MLKNAILKLTCKADNATKVFNYLHKIRTLVKFDIQECDMLVSNPVYIV